MGELVENLVRLTLDDVRKDARLQELEDLRITKERGDVNENVFRQGADFRGVRLESHRSIKRLLTKTTVLTERQADELAEVLAEALRPK